MKTIKSILLYFLVFSSTITISQNKNPSFSFFCAGQIENTFNYHNNYQGSPNDLYLDLNGDEINDLYFDVVSESYYGGEVIITTFSVTPLFQNLISTSSNSNDVIDGLNLGDTIQPSSINWSAGEKTYFIGENIDSYGSYQWESYLEDGYIGVLIPFETDTLYSWIFIKVEHFSFHSDIEIEAFTNWKFCNNLIDLGEDTVLSVSEVLILDAGDGYDSYLWNTGESDQSITVNCSDVGIGDWIYSVVATEDSCTYYDTINVKIIDNSGFSDIYFDNLTIRPNPFKDFISIQNPKEEYILIEISDISGKVLNKVSTSANNVQLDLEAVQSGLYFCRVSSGNYNKIYKLIKY